jgi:NAD(P)-dependent dehydrogenase (short-subunit alcohol dehydrogenase family)
MIGLTRSIAVTYGPQGVRCNAIAPGVIMVDEDPSQAAFHQSANDLLHRVGRPSDIADTVAFLAGDGEYINGQVITVDGGLIARMPSLSNK